MTLHTSGHAYCADCPMKVKRYIAERSDRWTQDAGGRWYCQYCTTFRDRP